MVSWFRLRRAVEYTPTVLIALARQSNAKTCASLMLDIERKKTIWTGTPGFSLLREVELAAASRKPVRPAQAAIQAKAIL